MANKWLDEVGQAIPKPLVPLARHVQSIWMPIPTGVGEWEVGCHVDEQHPEGRLSVTELVELLAFTIDDTPPRAAKKHVLNPPKASSQRALPLPIDFNGTETKSSSQTFPNARMMKHNAEGKMGFEEYFLRTYILK